MDSDLFWAPGPSERSKREKLISVLHPAVAGTIVTINRRLSRRLQRQYHHDRRLQGALVWEAPDILPRDAWLRRVWQECAARDPIDTPVLLSAVQENILWQQAIRNSPDAEELLDIPETALAAARAWDLLHAWELPTSHAAFADSADTQAFLTWMTAVEDQLHARHWITFSQVPAALTEFFPLGNLPHVEPISHVGFDEVTPRDRRLFNVLGAVPLASPPIQLDLLASANASRVGYRDATSELIQAALWARKKLEAFSSGRRKVQNTPSIAIVIPGLSAQTERVERIFDDIFHPGLAFATEDNTRSFHIASGVASSDVPLIAAALLLLGVQPGLTAAEVRSLLRSPFIALDPSKSARLDQDIRRHRTEIVGLRTMQEYFPEWTKHTGRLHWNDNLESNTANEASHRRPSDWSSVFSKLVIGAGWPGARALTSTEQQAVEHWKDLLSALASLDLILGAVSYRHALDRLRHIARLRPFHADDTDRSDAIPIQIMDLHEAAESPFRSNFDVAWITGLHAGAWPEPARPNPFLPPSLQRAAGLPHSSPDRELASARRATDRLLSLAPEIICSYPKNAGEEELRVSPLIENLASGNTVEFVADTVLQRIVASRCPAEELAVDPAPPLLAGTGVKGGTSLLQDQAACAFRAFAVHRLGARELDETELGVSPRERGSAVHRALDFLWKELKSRDELMSRPADDLAQLIERAASHALERNTSPERFRALEQQRLQTLLGVWLEQEKRRPWFEVVESELDREAQVGGLVLKIRPDRVDRYADGTQAIIDYKTAKDLKPMYWDGDRPDAPQLPLYAIDAFKNGHAVSEVSFAKLVPGETKWISRNGDELAQSLPLWRAVIENLAADFVAGHAQVNPKQPKQTCQFCKLHSFCRVNESGLLLGANESDEASGMFAGEGAGDQ